jgi:hypothetical protein
MQKTETKNGKVNGHVHVFILFLTAFFFFAGFYVLGWQKIVYFYCVSYVDFEIQNRLHLKYTVFIPTKEKFFWAIKMKVEIIKFVYVRTKMGKSETFFHDQSIQRDSSMSA